MRIMKNKIRNLIYVGVGLILYVLLCGGFGVTAQAEDEDIYVDFDYEENENGITITGYTGDETELVIPGEIDGMKVTSIGREAFGWHRDLTSITIPESVTSIEGWAFECCSGLTSIIIPDNVADIGLGVFSGCDKLENITVSK